MVDKAGAMTNQFYSNAWNGSLKARAGWAAGALECQEQISVLKKHGGTMWIPEMQANLDFALNQLKLTDLGMQDAAAHWYVAETLGIIYHPLTIDELRASLGKTNISDGTIARFVKKYGTFTK